LLHFIAYLTERLLYLLEFMMFARAILSWFPNARGSKVAEFLYWVTEPIIQPFRRLCDRFESLRMLPIDIAFLLAFFAIEFLQMFLRTYF
jgi:YggT family protein